MPGPQGGGYSASRGRPSGKGAVWTDADYAAHGYGQLRVRIPQAELDALRRIAADWGVHVTAAVRHLIAHAAELPAPNRKKPLSR